MSKNRAEIWQAGKVIEVKITADSEEMADQIFDLIELFGKTHKQSRLMEFLEREWRSDRG